MLSDEDVAALERAVQTCNEARDTLEDALDAAEHFEGDPTSASSILEPVAQALEDWRDGQKEFVDIVEQSAVDGVATVALLLRTNHGIDATNARQGLPGVPVEGADQPFELDVTATRGQVLTEAAMHHVDSDE